MRNKLMGVILAFLILFTIGCSTLPTQTNVPPSTLPKVVEKAPPDTSSWMSPAKVTLSNFHLGARAEYPITIHNGNEKDTKFSIIVDAAAYTASGYLKAPVDILQEWVLVADTTPVLARFETRELLVTLEMPSSLKEDKLKFWQVTDIATNRLSELMVLAYQDTKKSIYNSLLKKYPRASDIEPSMVEESITTKLLNEALLRYPESSLLTYLISKGSVSFGLLSREYKGDALQVEEFLSKGYVVKGNLEKDKWEFWVRVSDTSQVGNVQTEMASRWLVSMRG